MIYNFNKASAWLKKHPYAFSGGRHYGEAIYLSKVVSIPTYVRKAIAEYNREVCGIYTPNDDAFDISINHYGDVAYKSELSYDDLHTLGVL